MRILAESQAIARVNALKQELKSLVEQRYEHRAKSCLTCETKGACCLDVHFVNVRISRLEATAIRNVLDAMAEPMRSKVLDRIDRAIETFGLSDDPHSEKTYACPLFEPNIGCLVHNEGKPIPCILHACYENAEDLPPDHLLDEFEANAEILDRLTYGNGSVPLALPVAVSKAIQSSSNGRR